MTDASDGSARFRALPLILATVLLGAVACRGEAAKRAPARHTVEIRAFEFHPASLALSPGDTVVFVNRDAVPHTATGRDGAWDSGSIAAGARWSRVFPAAESAAYTCAFHPSMTGLLLVR